MDGKVTQPGGGGESPSNLAGGSFTAETGGPGRPVRFAAPLLALILGLAGYGIFELPYLIGSFAPMSSISYGVGFNNTVAVLVIWVAVVAVYALARNTPFAMEIRPVLSSSEPAPGQGLPLAHLAAGCAAYALLTALVSLISYGDYYSEQGYFMRRIYLTLEGYSPWRDFEFAYGPALLSLPTLAVKLLGRLGLEPRTTYQLLAALFNVCGVGLLYILVRAANLDRRRSIAMFWLLAVALWYPFLGLNSNLLRFTTAPASLILLDRLFSTPRLAGRPAMIATALGLLVGGNLMLSPELGTCFWLSASIYLVHRRLNGQREATPALLTGLAVVAAMLAALPDYMSSVINYAGGGASFPAFPAPHILLYLFGILLVIPLQAASVTRGGIGTDSLNLAFTALACALVPGAMGRSDPGHIINYGLSSFIIVFAVAARLGKHPFRVYAIAFFLVLTVGNQAANLVIIKRELGVEIYLGLKQRAPESVVTSVLGVIDTLEERGIVSAAELRQEIAVRSQPPVLDALTEFQPLGLPMQVQPHVETFLRENDLIAPDYYLDNLNVFGLEQIERKIQDTLQHELVLVRADFLQQYAGLEPNGKTSPGCTWETDWARLERYLSQLLKYPVDLERVNPIPYHRCLITGAVQAQFDPIREVDGHVVMRRKQPAPH